jgi:glutaredoxin
MKFIPVTLFVTGFLMMIGNADAEIYKWKDEQGKIHFSDQPSVTNEVDEVTVRVNTYTSPEVIDGDSQPVASDRVVMYSTSWCPTCKKAKRYFRKNNIPFVENDIEKSAIAKREFDRLGGGGVPVILVGKRRMNGFSAATFESIYRRQ